MFLQTLKLIAKKFDDTGKLKDEIYSHYKEYYIMISFEMMAKQAKTEILQIFDNGIVKAKGIFIPDAVTYFHDDDISAISYPDTGVFVLFKNSCVSSVEDKYKPYIEANGKTNREIIFQSRNAAAQFVLGSKGKANYWK